jgi:hypothetical protein
MKADVFPLAFNRQRRRRSSGIAASARIRSCITGSSLAKRHANSLRALEKSIRRNIGYRMELLRDDLKDNVKKLEAKGISAPVARR